VFSLALSITQRDALLDVAGAVRLVLEVVVGTVPVDAASERRGRDGKISPDHAHPRRQMRAFPRKVTMDTYTGRQLLSGRT
jgi:hypothetical protein